MIKEDRPDHIKAAINWCIELATKVNIYSAEFIVTQIVAKVFADTDDFDFYSNLNTLRDSIFAKQNKMMLSAFIARLEAYEKAEIQIREIAQQSGLL